jgi:hypothetical protein
MQHRVERLIRTEMSRKKLIALFTMYPEERGPRTVWLERHD